MAEREPINIWGKKYCELPSGERCDACCSVMGFEDKTFGKEGFVKEIGVPCRFQGSANNGKSGCGIYPFHPENCANTHCQNVTNDVKLLLVDEAQRLELVSSAEAILAKKRIENSH